MTIPPQSYEDRQINNERLNNILFSKFETDKVVQSKIEVCFTEKNFYKNFLFFFVSKT